MNWPLPPWHPHWDVWLFVFGLAAAYLYTDLRLRPRLASTADPATTRQRTQFLSGLALVWVVSDWPFADIAETALFSFHMVEHLVIVYAVPPLLLVGMPTWLADTTLGHPRLRGVLGRLAHPVVAFSAFNVALVAIHAPDAVALMVTNDLAHFTLHGVLFAVAVLAWLPIFSPTRHLPRLRPPMRMAYLFLQTIVPTVPASFLTFSTTPIYPVYGDAAEAYGTTAIVDQTVAGLIMKLGGGALLWSIIVTIWFRWIREERRWEAIERELAETDLTERS